MKSTKPRHEIKVFINLGDYYSIKNRLKIISRLDTNSGLAGKYLVRSLYFDSFNNKALMDKINGINQREKFRIRFYNFDASFIRLEKKSKVNGLCYKEGVTITRQECESILNNNIEWMVESNNGLLKELYGKMKCNLLKPKTIVDYIREAYVYDPGNVRITIDSEIRTGIYSKEFLNENLTTISVQDNKNMILEIKYDEFLPEIISDIIQTNNRSITAVSKYAACRMYG